MNLNPNVFVAERGEPTLNGKLMSTYNLSCKEGGVSEMRLVERTDRGVREFCFMVDSNDEYIISYEMKSGVVLPKSFIVYKIDSRSPDEFISEEMVFNFSLDYDDLIDTIEFTIN